MVLVITRRSCVRMHVAVRASVYARFERVNYDVKAFTPPTKTRKPSLLVQGAEISSTLAG